MAQHHAKGAVWTTPLLLQTNRLFTGAVVSPTGLTVAVLDPDGTLWTLPVTGGQPKQVTGLNITNYTEFLAWNHPDQIGASASDA